MDKNALINEISYYINTSRGNYVNEQKALKPDLIGLKMFDDPLVGFADAQDPYFNTLKNNDVIGGNFMLPEEWHDTAKTVISIFFPFTKEIKDTNKEDMHWPSFGWFHGRIEGQAFITETCKHIKQYLEDNGYKTVVPSIDKRFSLKNALETDINDERYYTSNWSERHVAYICGLGTFGLSKGLITAKGIAGRLGSVITDGYFEADTRNYTEIYEYCNVCGGCVKNCPAQAITIEHGKIHAKCNAFLETVKERHNPWYGCGKCQVKVSCESRIPINRKNGV